MELRDIEYFAVVAEHGHLGRAAEALGLSTPALSKSLRRLEKLMQAKLVRRTPKGVELTAEGDALFCHVHHLRLSLHDVAREVADIGQGRVGHLRIGTSPGIAEDLLAAAYSTLLKNAPRVTLTVPAAQTLLPQALRNGELDLILTTIPASPYEDLVQEHLFDDEFVVYTSVNHRLAERKRVTIADLAQERWALPIPDTPASQWLHRAFEGKGLAPPQIAIVAPSVPLKLRTVACSELLGFTSRRVVQRAKAYLRVVELPVKELSWTRRIGVSYRKDTYLPPAAKRFIEILKTTAEEIAAEKQ